MHSHRGGIRYTEDVHRNWANSMRQTVLIFIICNFVNKQNPLKM